jgi:cytochrome c oxidase subunit 2
MTISRLLPSLAALALGFAAPAQAADESSGWHLLNMREGVTAISREIYELHMLIFWVCVWIAVAVFGFMIYSLVKFRKSRGAVPDTTLVHNTKVEIAWTAVPVLILVAMAVPAARTLVAIEDTRDTQLTIKVTGYQWGWHYDYLESGVEFHSRLARDSDNARRLMSGVDPKTIPNYLLDVDNPLVVPAGVKVRLLVTAADVIHAWWVPDFGMKKDAIPGFVNEMWFKVDEDKTGTYRGQCVELCGRDHGFMPIVVDVKTPEDFAAWLKANAKTEAAPAATAQTQQPVANAG